MKLALSLVTLGVADVAASRAFYEKLGWVASTASKPEIAFFQVGIIAFALFGQDDLAQDAHLPPRNAGFGGMTLACNLDSKAAVDEMMRRAIAAGGAVLKPAQDVFWGGYSGYFADPDQHPWELAWNPFFPLGPDGQITLP